MDIAWKKFSVTAPLTDGIEVNRAYVDSNGAMSLTDNGGRYVSKLFVNSNSEIHYVDHAVVAAQIVDGKYTASGVDLATYLVDEHGNNLVTESGDFLII